MGKSRGERAGPVCGRWSVAGRWRLLELGLLFVFVLFFFGFDSCFGFHFVCFALLSPCFLVSTLNFSGGGLLVGFIRGVLREGVMTKLKIGDRGDLGSRIFIVGWLIEMTMIDLIV